MRDVGRADDELSLRVLLGHLVGAVARQTGLRGVLAGMLILVGAAMESGRLALLVPIIDALDHRGPASVWTGRLERGYALLGIETPLGRLAVLVGAFVVATAIRAAIFYWRDLGLVRLSVDMANSERFRLVRLISSAPWQRIAALDHARVTNIVSVEAPRVGSSAQLLVQSATNLVLILFQLAIAFVLAPRLAAAMLVLSVIVGSLVLLGQRRTIERGRRFARANQALLATTARLLAGLKAAIAQDAQSHFVGEFDTGQRTVRDLELEVARSRGRRNLWIGISGATVAGIVVLLAFGAFDVRLSVMLTTMFIVVRMAGPAARVFQAVQTLAFALPGYRLIAALEEELRAGSPPVAPVVAVTPAPGAVELRAVTYRHFGDGGGGVTDVDLVLEPGAIIGVSGPSGHGKTTMLDILAGLLQPESGFVLAGGDDLADPALRRGWQRQIGYVAQDCFVFNDTLRRNLTWGSDADDDALVLQAAHLAGADPLVARLGGLDAVIGERGSLLSGGERQRIAIARALLRRPRLLLLDEATSGLDPDSEAALLDRLAALPDRPTILLVSHRGESMRRCDRVVSVREGRLVG